MNKRDKFINRKGAKAQRREGKCRGLLVLLMLIVGLSALHAQSNQQKNQNKVLIVVFDGLRPDYITQELMPNVFAFSREGCYAKEHHSVFPTVTRVNGASYASGSYPATHGILGNTVYFPEIDPKQGLNTGNYEDLNKISEATHGQLLTAISIGEVLQKAGEKLMIFSSGSTGQALMQNHKISGGAVVNPGLILPASLKDSLTKMIGPIPADTIPNTTQHKWVTDALISYGLSNNGARVNAIWYSDPDGAAHSDGIGSPAAMQSIRQVDAEFGRIMKALKQKNMLKHTDVIITADHGFVTYGGNVELSDFLINQKLKQDKDSEDVLVVDGAIYVKDHNLALMQKIVTALQSQEWVGAIFTKGDHWGALTGIINGTLSFESIHWDHPSRAADILVDKNWDERKNTYGYAGTSFSKGVAGHGGLSPYEVHIALLAKGPNFKKGFVSELATSNVDIVPTILAISGIPIPASMNGRVIDELLRKKNNTKAPVSKKETVTTSATFPGGSYTVTLERSVVGVYKYVDYARVVRK